MSILIPESHLHFFEQPIYANLGTIMPDGRPQVNPVWCDYDGAYVRFSTLEGSQKDKNLRSRQFATLLLVDPQNQYSWIEVRGNVAEVTTEGAEEFIDALTKQYLGLDSYPNRREGDVRLIYKIKPERVNIFNH